MIYIDITDFLLFVRNKIRVKSAIIPTGIERVVLEYAKNGINLEQAKCVYYSSIKNKYFEIQNQTIEDIYGSNIEKIQYLQKLDIQKTNLLRIFARYRYNIPKMTLKSIQYIFSQIKLMLNGKFEHNFKEANFEKNDVLLFLCAPAILRKYSFLQKLKAKLDIKMMMFVHDLMPINLDPKYIPSKGLTKETDFFIRKSVNIIDQYLVSTKFSKTEMEEFFVKINVKKSVSLVKFGFGGKQIKDIAPCVAGKFILTVSTIEVRKNHITLVKAWHSLVKNNLHNGYKLVIVGKWGWKVNQLKQYLKQNEDLNQHIVILNKVDDENLASLYKNCAFTVFPSVAEGYGLPVAESFYYGKLCVASNNAVMQEVGGNLCHYFETFNTDELANKIQHLIHNENELEEINTKIASIKITSWFEASQDLYEKINKI